MVYNGVIGLKRTWLRGKEFMMKGVEILDHGRSSLPDTMTLN